MGYVQRRRLKRRTTKDGIKLAPRKARNLKARTPAWAAVRYRKTDHLGHRPRSNGIKKGPHIDWTTRTTEKIRIEQILDTMNLSYCTEAAKTPTAVSTRFRRPDRSESD